MAEPLSIYPSINQRLYIVFFTEFWDNGIMALIGYARVSTHEQHLHSLRFVLFFGF